MPQSLAKILLHIIFSTKNRMPLLKDEIREPLHGYMAGVLKKHDSPAIVIGSVENHIHVLCLLSRTQTVAGVVEEIKKSTSKWIKTNGVAYSKFQWQSGYGAFSVSESNRAEVETYIQNQREHHRTRTFEEEYRAFLKRYNVPYDERYVWD
ncbi:MAG: transposase [Verrucomicrobiae bacterium]|nr:transposase [Verrucomicrobiae bacterium]